MTHLPIAAEPDSLVVTQRVTNEMDYSQEQSGVFVRLRRRKLVLLGAMALTLGLIGAAYTVIPNSYVAQANIILAGPEPLLGGGDPIFEQKQGDPADVESQVFALGSFNLLNKVTSLPANRALIERECDIERKQLVGRFREFLAPADCRRYISDPAAAATYLQNRVSVSENGRSRIITVSYSSPVAELSRGIPNAIVNAFIADKLQDKLDSRLDAVTWLRSESARVSLDLSDTEARIEAFRREHGLIQGQNAPLASEQLTAIDRELAAARAVQSENAAMISQIRGGAASARVTLENRAIGDLKQQLATVSRQAAEIESSHGPSYPPLSGMRREQATLSAQLAMETARIRASLQQDYASSNARVAALEQQLLAAKQQVAAGTGAATEIASLQRHADIQRELYIDLSKKIDAIETERRMVTGNARVVSYAQLPETPAFPRKLPFVLGGLIAAVGVGVGSALMIDRGDRSIRTKRSVELAAGVPVLGYIPAVDGARLANCAKVGTPSPLQEAVRTLYAHCVLLRGVAPPRTILVTSAQPHDGKTFVTLALAHFAACCGKTVLAIECDLRQPDFENALALHSAPGLSDYLRGNATCEDVVRPSHMPGLHILAAGEPAADSTELISNGRIDGLLAWAQSRFDLILIDSPPSRRLMDASLLARRTDGVLFCARWGTSATELVSEAVQELSLRGANVLGLVIDRVETRQLPLYDGPGAYDANYPPRRRQSADA